MNTIHDQLQNFLADVEFSPGFFNHSIALSLLDVRPANWTIAVDDKGNATTANHIGHKHATLLLQGTKDEVLRLLEGSEESATVESMDVAAMPAPMLTRLSPEEEFYEFVPGRVTNCTAAMHSEPFEVVSEGQTRKYLLFPFDSQATEVDFNVLLSTQRMQAMSNILVNAFFRETATVLLVKTVVFRVHRRVTIAFRLIQGVGSPKFQRPQPVIGT